MTQKQRCRLAIALGTMAMLAARGGLIAAGPPEQPLSGGARLRTALNKVDAELVSAAFPLRRGRSKT